MKDAISILMSPIKFIIESFLNIRRTHREQNKIKENLWQELDDLKTSFEMMLDSLLIEFDQPVKTTFVKSIDIDWEYINELQRGLGSNMPFPIRKALKEIKIFHNVLSSVIDKRNDIARRINDDGVLLNRQLTARSILEISKLLYVIIKLLETKENYSRGLESDVIDIMRSLFKTNTKYQYISEEKIQAIFYQSAK